MHDFSAPDWSTLPAPPDDGGARHLVGAALPSAPLEATNGDVIDLARLPGRTVIYAYPLTGRPGVALPEGWDGVPGARGCTPQSCAFRDHYAELRALGVGHVFGLSSQTSAYQAEAAERLHLPFALLSDHDFAFADAMRLPTFEAKGVRLLKRLTMICTGGRVEHVFYPVFPPDKNAAEVVDWLRTGAM